MGGCSSEADVTARVESVNRDLQEAGMAGAIDANRAMTLGGRIAQAAMRWSVDNNHQAYCESLESIRRDLDR